MIRGDVVDPKLTLDNPEIVRRHIRAFLLQNYHQDRQAAGRCDVTWWLIGAVVIVYAMLLLAFWAAADAGARSDERTDRAESYRRTRGWIDEAGTDVDSASADDVARRLREHADQ